MFYLVWGREVLVNKFLWYIVNCNVCLFYVWIFFNLLFFVICVWWCWVVMLYWKNLFCLKSCIFRNGILFSMIVVFVGLKWVRVVFVFILFFGFICCLNRFLMMFEFRKLGLKLGLKLFCFVKNNLYKDIN